MVRKNDIYAYLLEKKTLLLRYAVQIYSWAVPQVLHLKSTIQAKKEIILKISIPFFIILWGFYACTSSQRVISHNLDDIFNISDDIRNNYADKPNYWGLSTEKTIHDSLVSKKFIHAGKIVLTGGENILIGNGANADIIMPNMTTFDIVLKYLNKAQCISYVEAPLSSDNLVKLSAIHIINANGTFSFEWGEGKYTLPIRKYSVKDICDIKDNIVVWTFQ